jgi:hypothetical protein
VLADPRASEDPSTDDQAETSRTAAGLAALLRRSPAESLSAGEATLLQEWLARLSDTR